MAERKTTSIKVNPDLWKETKKLAIDRGIEVSELVEGALKKELQKK
jgi:post-segregation antitoxin (ccd killing protein)